jgi:RNA polymerase sigma-70 factor (ECF subfamily)
VLAAMPFQDRGIFVWAELEGLSYAEIARIENLPLGTVKSRLARIRAKLKQSLSKMSN